jgi:hypothetical protein
LGGGARPDAGSAERDEGVPKFTPNRRGRYRISGEVLEAIVFVEEAAPLLSEPGRVDAEDIFAEMKAFMVEAADVDDSREAIYTRMERE